MASFVERKRKNGKKDIYISQRFIDSDGKKKQALIPCSSKSEARMLLDEVAEAEKAGRKYVHTPTPSVYETSASSVYSSTATAYMTVSELIDEYLEEKCTALVGTTLDNYVSIAKNYINPFIGDTLISAITPRFIQNYYNDLPNHKSLKKESITPRMVKDIHKILRPAFNHAVTNDAIPFNPAISVKLPKMPKTKRKQLSENQVKQIFEIKKDEYQDLYTKMNYACTLRSGECSALTWNCVDVSEESIASGKASIYVDKALRRMSHVGMKRTKYKDIIYVFPNMKADATTALVLKATKNDGSARRIYLPTSLARQLIEHKATQEAKIAEVGDNYHDYGFHFVFTQLNGRPYTVESHSRKFKRLLVENDLPDVHAYSLRHSGSTAKLRASGGNIKSVQGDMGHSSPEMLMKVYAEIVDEDRVNNATLMEERLFSKLGNDNEDSPQSK